MTGGSQSMADHVDEAADTQHRANHKRAKKGTKKPHNTGITHNWRRNESSNRWECHTCGSFSRKEKHSLEYQGCPGETPRDFDKLRLLKHKPMSYDCSDGDVITVCTSCFATSSPTSAATSYLSKPCLGAHKHNHRRMQERYHQTILKGKHPQKNGVAVFLKKGSTP